MEIEEDYSFLDELFTKKKEQARKKKDFITDDLIEFVEEHMKEEF